VCHNDLATLWETLAKQATSMHTLNKRSHCVCHHDSWGIVWHSRETSDLNAHTRHLCIVCVTYVWVKSLWHTQWLFTYVWVTYVCVTYVWVTLCVSPSHKRSHCVSHLCVSPSHTFVTMTPPPRVKHMRNKPSQCTHKTRGAVCVAVAVCCSVLQCVAVCWMHTQNKRRRVCQNDFSKQNDFCTPCATHGTPAVSIHTNAREDMSIRETHTYDENMDKPTERELIC